MSQQIHALNVSWAAGIKAVVVVTPASASNLASYIASVKYHPALLGYDAAYDPPSLLLSTKRTHHQHSSRKSNPQTPPRFSTTPLFGVFLFLFLFFFAFLTAAELDALTHVCSHLEGTISTVRLRPCQLLFSNNCTSLSRMITWPSLFCHRINVVTTESTLLDH
jgi:hypothetical protein